jgi:AcrR family transcriptional regulator
MPRARAPGHDQQRELILRAAVDAFASTGFPSATMAGLARACGVSKATLYHYFEGKEALLFEALQRHTAALLTLVERARSQAEPGPARWTAVVRGLMPAYRRSRAVHAVLIRDVRFLPPVQRATIESGQRAIVDAIAMTISEAFPGRVPPEHLKATTMALLGMLNFSFAWLRPDGPMSYEAFGELVLEISLHGLGGSAQHG